MNLNIPLHSLSPKELEIMQYVHEHSDAIVSMSIQTFAQEINYSTSTVIRFCRKLGFSGFPEFKYSKRTKSCIIRYICCFDQEFDQS